MLRIPFINPVLAVLFCFFWGEPPNDTATPYKIVCDACANAICDKVKAATTAATRLSETGAFASAVADIRIAEKAYNKEYVVSFGKDSLGNILRSPATEGNMNSGALPPVKNRLADIHIHTNEKPPSSGDLYGFTELAITDSGYLRYTLTPGGKLYAFALINKNAALHFLKSFPKRAGIRQKDQKGMVIYYQPTFPAEIVEEFNKIKGWSGASDEVAMAFILQKYNTGVALLKQNAAGDFKRLVAAEQQDKNGNSIFSLVDCR